MTSFENNASAVQTGFHYQDFAALYFFISDIKNISEINVEGQEDFDLTHTNGQISFFQVKEIEDISKPLSSTKIRSALNVLSKDFLSVKSNDIVSRVGIITNSNRPFGPSSSGMFLSMYMQLAYDQLTPGAKKKINKQLDKLGDHEKQAFDIQKLTITKLHYFGNDTESKLQQLELQIKRLLGSARIGLDKYDALLNGWRMLFTQSTENSHESISKEHFAYYTDAIVIDTPQLDKFFLEFNIIPGNQGYIENQYACHLKMLGQDFKILSRIDTAYKSFVSDNLALDFHSSQVKFINNFASEMLEALGLTNSSADLDISKLVIWLVIRQRALFSSIGEAFGVVY